MVPVAAHAQTLIANGNFENVPNPGGFTEYVGGRDTLPGWTITGHIDVIGNYWAPSPAGGNNIDLNGLSAGGIAQTVTTRTGTSYTLSFFMWANPQCGSPVKQMRVLAGPTGATYNHSANAPWTRHQISFTATSAATPIAFTSLENSACGPVIDNVVLVANGGAAAVPAPPPPPAPAPISTYRPCYLDSYARWSAGPCSGGPGTPIILRIEQTLPSQPAALVFRQVVVNGVPARITTRLTGGGRTSGSFYSIPAPRQLCVGNGGKWMMTLITADGRSQGDSGSFTIRC